MARYNVPIGEVGDPTVSEQASCSEGNLGGVSAEPRLDRTTSGAVSAESSTIAMEVEGEDAKSQGSKSSDVDPTSVETEVWTSVARKKQLRRRRERENKKKARQSDAVKLRETGQQIRELKLAQQALSARLRGKPKVETPQAGPRKRKRQGRSAERRSHTGSTTGKLAAAREEVRFLGSGGYTIEGQKDRGREPRCDTHLACCTPYLGTWYRLKAHLDVHHHQDCRYYCWVCGERFGGNQNRRHLLTDHCHVLKRDVDNPDAESRRRHREYSNLEPGLPVGGLWHQLPSISARYRNYSPFRMTHHFTAPQLKAMGIIQKPPPVPGTLTKSSDKGKVSDELRARRRSESVSVAPSSPTKRAGAKKPKGEVVGKPVVPSRPAGSVEGTSGMKLRQPSEFKIPKVTPPPQQPTYSEAAGGSLGPSRAEPAAGAWVRLDPAPSRAISVVGAPALHGRFSAYPYRILHGEVFYSRSYWADGSVESRRPPSVEALTKSTLAKSAEPKH